MKTLPLGLLLLWIVVLVGMVCSLDESEIRCSLYMNQPTSSVRKLCIHYYIVERCRIGIKLSLKEEAGHI